MNSLYERIYLTHPGRYVPRKKINGGLLVGVKSFGKLASICTVRAVRFPAVHNDEITEL